MIDAIYVSRLMDGSAGRRRHRLLPVGRPASSSSIYGFYGTALCTRLSHQGKLALTGLVKVDDEEAAANTAGAVVLAPAREEVRAAEVALPAVGRFPSYLQSMNIAWRIAQPSSNPNYLTCDQRLDQGKRFIFETKFTSVESDHMMASSLAPRRLLTEGR